MLCTELQIPEGHEVDLEKSDLKTGTIWFKKIEPKYPKSIIEVKGRSIYLDDYGRISVNPNKDPLDNHMTSIGRADSILVLIQLLELRDRWNEIDGFVADWCDGSQTKYFISYVRNIVDTHHHSLARRVLHFGSPETRDLFLKTFRDLIEQAKELI